MAIQFPADPASQTPINTLSPNSTPIANTENTLTYVWNGSAWIGSGDPADVAPNLQAVTDQGNTTTNSLQVGPPPEVGDIGINVVSPGGLAAASVGTNLDGQGAQNGGHLGVWYSDDTGAQVFTSTGDIRICTDGALPELESSITLGGGLEPTENNWLVLNSEGAAAFSGKATSAETEEDDSDATLVTKGYVDAQNNYQQGTWNPYATTEGSFDQNAVSSYQSQTGVFTRIGQQVTATFWLAADAVNWNYVAPASAASNFYVGLLPYDVDPNKTVSGSSLTFIQNSADFQFRGYVTQQGQYPVILFTKFVLQGGSYRDVVAQFQNIFGNLGSGIQIQVTYITDDTDWIPQNGAQADG